MTQMARVAAIVVALVTLMPAAASPQAHGDHVMVAPADLKWADVPSLPPGAKIAVIEGPMNEAKPFTIRLRLPADYQIPAHFHSGIEHVTVISGTFNLGMGDKLDTKATRALGPGSVAIMQPGTRHFGWTKQETVVQVHGVGPWTVNYVNAADDPRKK
jgi:quercetin dioxygenase-like cupin family protein